MNEFPNEMISFEALAPSHMGMLHEWFNVPHVKKWYAREMDYGL